MLGDGNRVVHLGDRDCSIQRRFQKLVEEAPAPGLPDDMREALRGARSAARPSICSYRGAGTVEFLVDAETFDFFFLEMNARIQVEHPVTEAISGIDLVEQQLLIADGQPLGADQEMIALDGHAIEVRINAEDWRDDFRPSPGIVRRAAWPAGPGIRVDSHIAAGGAVPAFYDSLIGKIIVAGRLARGSGGAAPRRSQRCAIEGVETTAGLHRCASLADPRFVAGGVDTRFFDGYGAVDKRPWLKIGSSTSRSATAIRACGARPASTRRRCLEIAGKLDRAGFRAIDFTSSTHMAVAVRYFRNNPWERIRRMRAAMPRTPLQLITTGLRFIAWQQADPEFMRLVYRRLQANGIRRFIMLDPMHDPDAVIEASRLVKEEGEAEVMGALTFTLSDVHDDEFYADFAGKLAASPHVDLLLSQGSERADVARAGAQPRARR